MFFAFGKKHVLIHICSRGVGHMLCVLTKIYNNILVLSGGITWPCAVYIFLFPLYVATVLVGGISQLGFIKLRLCSILAGE